MLILTQIQLSIMLQRQRPWIQLLINLYLHLPDFCRQQTVPAILAWSSKLMIELSSKSLQEQEENNTNATVGGETHLLLDLLLALGFIGRQSELCLPRLSEFHQAFLVSSQISSFSKNKRFLVDVSKILALEGLAEASSLACYLKLTAISLENNGGDTFLVPYFVSILQKTFCHTEEALPFGLARSLSRYMEHINNLIAKGLDVSAPADSPLPELKFHFAIFKRLDKRTLKSLVPFLCTCVKSIVKSVLALQSIFDVFKITPTLNIILLGTSELLSDPSIAGSPCLVEIQDDLRFLSCSSVLFLAPSLLPDIQIRYPRFAELLGDHPDTKSIDECSISLLSSVQSTLHCIRVVKLYCADSFDQKKVVGRKIVNFLKASIGHIDFWRNFSCLAGWGLENHLTAWLGSTRIASKEVYEAILYAWSHWACFLTSCLSISRNDFDCTSSQVASSLDSFARVEISLESFEGLLELFEKLWSHHSSGPGAVIAETLVCGLIRLFHHTPSNLTLRDSFQALVFQMHKCEFKNVRALSR